VEKVPEEAEEEEKLFLPPPPVLLVMLESLLSPKALGLDLDPKGRPPPLLDLGRPEPGGGENVPNKSCPARTSLIFLCDKGSTDASLTKDL
jgi:hypothetical protein